MKSPNEKLVQDNPWADLRKHTRARIALGRCGSAIPTQALLDFRLCHAGARDAVLQPLDFPAVQQEIESVVGRETLLLQSAAANRNEYLQRPDLGATLAAGAAQGLRPYSESGGFDIALVIADGLSAMAVAQNIVPLFNLLIPQVKRAGYTLAPVCLVEQGRVAVGDEIGSLLQAALSVICIGERPGLQAHNSMGIYLTYNARPGTTNDRRNCISNIRPEGLGYRDAVAKLLYLIEKALRLELSGVALKDEQVVQSPVSAIAPAGRSDAR